MGADVTVIEFMDRLSPAMDTEIMKKFQSILKKARRHEIQAQDQGHQECGGRWCRLTMEPSKVVTVRKKRVHVVLVATGRRPTQLDWVWKRSVFS
jgi:dihydrolipoamide dehydrogenase